MPRNGLLRLVLFACFMQLRAPAALHAQTHPVADPGPDLDAGTNGTIPEKKGFNASLNTSSQHDSSNGWSSFFTPDVAFRFNRNFSADAYIPLYAYIVAYVQTGTVAKPVYKYQTLNHSIGDTQINGRFETHHDFLDYLFVGTLGLPTGNKDYGLGAGQYTYSLINHFEHGYGAFTPDIEIGVADSSSLVSSVNKSYVAVGTMVYFQAGTGVELPRGMSFEADAYEELPVTRTTIYSTTGKGKKKVTTATNEGAAEDNGFMTELDIPLDRHVVLVGFYNRSLINKIDTAGFGFTFLLRRSPLEHKEVDAK